MKLACLLADRDLARIDASFLRTSDILTYSFILRLKVNPLIIIFELRLRMKKTYFL